MVKHISKHHLKILGGCFGVICLLIGYCFGQGVFQGGVPADVFEIGKLSERLSHKIDVSNIEFEHIEQAITTVTMRMMMWQDSNAEFVEIVDCLTSMTIVLGEIRDEIHRGIP